MRPKIVGVMGPGNPAEERVNVFAFELGRAIGESGLVLLTGGRAQGVMDAASKGASETGGLVLGILPDSDKSAVSQFVDIAVFTDMGSGRNNINILTADVVVAVGIGPGTASEISLAIKAGKSVILTCADDATRTFFTSIGKDKVKAADTVEDAIEQIRQAVSA